MLPGKLVLKFYALSKSGSQKLVKITLPDVGLLGYTFAESIRSGYLPVKAWLKIGNTSHTLTLPFLNSFLKGWCTDTGSYKTGTSITPPPHTLSHSKTA